MAFVLLISPGRKDLVGCLLPSHTVSVKELQRRPSVRGSTVCRLAKVVEDFYLESMVPIKDVSYAFVHIGTRAQTPAASYALH